MAYSEALSDRTIAISISDSPDLGPIGMSVAHLRDAMAEFSRHLLALGARIAYGGDLRVGGFSEVLFELVARHRRDADEGDTRPGVVSYLAWPVHISRDFDQLVQYAEELADTARLILLDKKGATLDRETRRVLKRHDPDPSEWVNGLAAMRRTVNDATDARIIAGGQVADFKGVLPGIAEEALLAMNSGKPLFVLGGFGGCASDIANSLGLSRGLGQSKRHWAGREAFHPQCLDRLSNGLSDDENRTLAETPHVDEAITLILRGLLRLKAATYPK